MAGPELTDGAPPPAAMTDEDLRVAFRRVADPLGTPVRATFLVLNLALIGWYQACLPETAFRTALQAGTAAAVLFYAATSLWVRRRSARESPRWSRERFLQKARARSLTAYQLLIQSLFWLAVAMGAGWLYILAAPGPPYTFGIFLTATAVLLGLRYLLERFVDIPRVRRDLAALEVEGAPPPAP